MNIRKKYIADCVEHFKKKYPEDYKAFCVQTQARREELKDKNFGVTRDDKELRLGISMPEKLWNMLAFAFVSSDEPKFGEVKGEMKWFTRKFPEFLIPSRY